MSIGSIFKVKIDSVTLVDNKTKFESTIKRGDIITLVDFKLGGVPVVLSNNRTFELLFDYYHGDSFDQFFDKVNLDA